MKKRSGSKVSIVKRRREAEQLLMNAVKQGKANFLEKDLPTDWRPTPPMPPSMIKMVLWDMDRTLLKTHTRGLWKDDIAKLAEEVTRAFKIVVPHLLHQKFSVGIVTFSDKLRVKSGKEGIAGEDLVGDLILETFSDLYSKVRKLKDNKDYARKNAEHIRDQLYIAAALPKLRNRQENKGAEMPNSKSWHIDQVIKEYKERTGSTLSYDEIMLFDDTLENVEAALKSGVHAFAVLPKSAFTSSCWEVALEAIVSPNSTKSRLAGRER
eukprot:jgi/Bigna1/88780/estExt_fgenesh1_pg.C_380030